MVNIINQNIFNGISGARPSYAPKYYVLHNDAGSKTAEGYIEWLQGRYDNGQSDLGFAHYYIDRNSIVRVEETYNGSWSAANYDANMNSLSYEVCQQFSTSDNDFIENENMVLMQMAEDMSFYGDTPNYDNIKFHNEFSATSCPERSLQLHGGDNDSLRDYVIEKIKYYQSIGSTVEEMLNNTSSNTGWNKNSVGWWYVNNDGSYPMNEWQKIDDAWYYFDEQGYMKANTWHKHSDGYWYYLLPNGTMATGWVLISNKWYYFNNDGTMFEGWLKYKDKYYYLKAESGDMVSKECRNINGVWYYFNGNGEMLEQANITVDETGAVHFE